MKKQYLHLIIASTVALLFSACIDENIPEESLKTFVGETITSYCTDRDEFSIFRQLIEDTQNSSLLASYGHYTCFLPGDEAFKKYFKEKNISYSELTYQEKRTIIFNHIVKGENKIQRFYSGKFEDGALPIPNMNNRFISISFAEYSKGSQTILVNGTPILHKDIEIHNAVIHEVGGVIELSNEYLLGVLKENENFQLFSEALELTHLADSVLDVYDYSYIRPFDNLIAIDRKTFYYPDEKKYGFTIFAETDKTFKNAGIETLEQLIEYASKYYGTAAKNDFPNRKNPLNQFVSYHLLNRQMATNAFLYSGKATAPNAEDKKYEYYETMLQYRLVEIKSGNKINTQKNGTFVSLDEYNSNLNGINGYVHGLNEILVYDEERMENDVLNKRIRFDCYAIPPQMTNNNIRWQTLHKNYTVTPDYCGDYFKFSNETVLQLFADEYWHNHQADEMLMAGWYDFTLRMLPVPPGTYEIRLGYNAEDWRGVAQLFLDGEIVGIPVDLRIHGTDPRVGWVKDELTMDNGVENDKMMRNRGYMKAPNSLFTLNSGQIDLRQASHCLRIIVGTFTFQDYAPHYFRVRNVESADLQFHFDYLEYVPVSYLETEGRD